MGDINIASPLLEQLSTHCPKAFTLFKYWYDKYEFETVAQKYLSFDTYCRMGNTFQMGVLLKFLDIEYNLMVLPTKCDTANEVDYYKLELPFEGNKKTPDVFELYYEGIVEAFKMIEDIAKNTPSTEPTLTVT